MSVFAAFLDLVYPPLHSCLLCSAAFSPKGRVELCQTCLDSLPLVNHPLCAICGRPLRPWEISGDGRALTCRDCLPASGRPRRFAMSRSPLVYDGLARDLLIALKFQGKYRVAEPIGQLMAAYMEEMRPFPKVDILVPVPVHHERLEKRGYNQAELLARGIVKTSRIPFANLLDRVRMSETQSLTDLAKRRENVRGCFAVRRPGDVAGKAILLVDDIYTTGATLDECAGELLRCGARTVIGFSAAVVVPA